MLAQFPVIAVDAVMRRTLRSCIAVAVVGVVVAIALGAPLVAPGIVLGLAAGLLNQRLVLASTAHYTTEDGKVQRRPFAGSVALRLGAVTAVTFVLLFVLRPMGWGMLGGLIGFQLVLMVNSMVALLHYQRAAASQPGDHTHRGLW